MQFRILGPLEVVDGDSVVPLAGVKQRALLALLLLNANEVVSSDRLVEALWGEHLPVSGAKALQVRVSQLRKALGVAGSVVVTRAPGYRLQIEGEQFDLARFERLVAEADDAAPTAAAGKLREALTLWRGPPLADLAYEPFAQPAIARLEELRLVAIEKRIDADLALGRHLDLVGELEQLAAAHPLRERVRAQLMLALYRCGRQADALAVYQHARRELVDELGIEPSPSLRELEQAILRQDPSLEPAPAASHALPDQAAEVSPGVVEPRHNLPSQASSFVGRERELSELRELLARARLLTLVGAGGVGKTRLALQLATAVLDGWRDGVWFVDLAPVADATLVDEKVASIFGVLGTPGRSPQESLVMALRPRELVVVLDNCEHLIESAAILADMLVKECPSIAIVATSREPLRIPGEQIYRVSSLSLPPLDAQQPQGLADSEAICLFIDRARRQRPEFALDSDNWDAVARLCRRLDGIPLAIELAAARLSVLGLDDIEKRLDQRFALLVGGNRTAVPRQQTLQALVDWSYNLLDPGEQEVLQRLSVFAGGFDLDGAEAVAKRGQSASALDEVVALVDKSLVQWGDTDNRYRLLETVRDYAATKLRARGETEVKAVRVAHRDYYLALAEAAAPHLIGHEQAEWLDRLQLELDNLSAAISECATDPDPEPGLRLAHALHYFWEYRQPSLEGAHAVCAALDRPDAKAPTLLRGQALVAAADLLAIVIGDYDAAGDRCREALSIARTLSDERLRALALCRLLAITVSQGNEDTHASLADEAVRAARAVCDPHLTAQILLQSSASSRVPHGERVRALKEGLALSRQSGDRVLSVRMLDVMGYDALEAGEIGAARALLEEALGLFRDTGDQIGLAFCTCNLGFAEYLDCADTVARTRFDETLRIARHYGDLYMVAHAQLGLALIAARAGDASAAANLHGAADAIHKRLGTQFVAVESRLRDSDIAALREQLGNAAFERAYNAGCTTDIVDPALA